MTFITYTICDGCGIRLFPITTAVKVALGDRTADACSLECAQRWIAALWEDAGIPLQWNLLSPEAVDPS